MPPDNENRVSCYYWVWIDEKEKIHPEDLKRTLVNGQSPKKTDAELSSDIKMHSFPIHQDGRGRYVLVRDLTETDINMQLDILLAIYLHYTEFPPNSASIPQIRELISMLYQNIPQLPPSKES